MYRLEASFATKTNSGNNLTQASLPVIHSTVDFFANSLLSRAAFGMVQGSYGGSRIPGIERRMAYAKINFLNFGTYR